MLCCACAALDSAQLCRRYSATDHAKFNKTGDVKHCPAEAICENCMPLPPNGTETCWAVRTPILYQLTGWHKIQDGSHGQARALLNMRLPACRAKVVLGVVIR